MLEAVPLQLCVLKESVMTCHFNLQYFDYSVYCTLLLVNGNYEASFETVSQNSRYNSLQCLSNRG